jgi:hypothetical protein
MCYEKSYMLKTLILVSTLSSHNIHIAQPLFPYYFSGEQNKGGLRWLSELLRVLWEIRVLHQQSISLPKRQFAPKKIAPQSFFEPFF